MESKEFLNSRPPRKIVFRALKYLLLITVVFAILVFFLVPAWLSSETGRKAILNKINTSVEGKVDFGDLSISWFKGIVIKDVQFNDTPEKVRAGIKLITTRPHYLSILRGELSFDKIFVTEPEIKIRLDPSVKRTNNISTPDSKVSKKPSIKPVPIKRLTIIVKNGVLEITDRMGRSARFSQINSRLNLQPLGNQRDVAGHIECVYDWGEIGDLAGSLLPTGLVLQGKRKDTVRFASQFDIEQPEQILANLNARTTIGFEKADYMGLVFSPSEVDIKVEQNLLKIGPFSAKVNNGKLSFASEIDLQQSPRLLKTPHPISIAKDIEINKQTTEQMLRYINPIFANALTVSGVANLDCERLIIPLEAGAKNRAEIIGTISMNRVRLEASDLLGQILSAAGADFRGEVITVRPSRFVLKDGFVKYDDMQVDVGNKPVNFMGRIGLDKSLNMTVVLPYTLQGRTVRVGEKPTSERISLPLRGTINRPELDTAALLEQQLRKHLEKELQKGLEKLLEERSR